MILDGENPIETSDNYFTEVLEKLYVAESKQAFKVKFVSWILEKECAIKEAVGGCDYRLCRGYFAPYNPVDYLRGKGLDE